ncbi:MAG: glycosyltransferase [Burkholderiaceae bacterium]|nr:glycosyltransferase [Rhodoferax sp.]MCP5285818.1 glycosyltransferase [Burkholderiaceae bacterium]
MTSAPRAVGTAPRLLMASTQHWDSPFQVGSHHIARAFARRGWRVAFLGAPVQPAHLLGAGLDARQRVSAWRRGGTTDPATGIWHHVPFAPLPWGASRGRRGRQWVRLAWALARPGLAATLRAEGFATPELACTDHFLHEGLLRAAVARWTVYRRADDPATMPGAGPDFAARDLDFARRAALTVCPTRSAAAGLAAAGITSPMVLPNGVDLDRFLAAAAPPPEYAADGRPVAIYVGADDHRFDAALLAHVANAVPQLRWVVVGQVGERSAGTLRSAGVDLLGPQPHAALPAYLQHARLGLVPFRLDSAGASLRDVNPLKVLEYAASGLPVVATTGCSFPADLPTPLHLCNTAEGFVSAVRQVLAVPPPQRPDPAALAPFGWDARLAPLFNWLAQRGLPA